MAELVLLLFALLALGSPPVSICFALAAIGVSVWRQYNLRKEHEELRQESYKQNDALHRELIDLRRQLAAATRPATEADRTPAIAEPPARIKDVPQQAEARRTEVEPLAAAVKAPTDAPLRVSPQHTDWPSETAAPPIETFKTERASPELEKVRLPASIPEAASTELAKPSIAAASTSPASDMPTISATQSPTGQDTRVQAGKSMSASPTAMPGPVAAPPRKAPPPPS